MLPEVLLHKLGLANPTETMHCTRSLSIDAGHRVERLMNILKLPPSTNKLLVPRRQRATDIVLPAGSLNISRTHPRRRLVTHPWLVEGIDLDGWSGVVAEERIAVFLGLSLPVFGVAISYAVVPNIGSESRSSYLASAAILADVQLWSLVPPQA